MATNVRYTNALTNGQLKSATANAGRFILHFVQMFVAMMVGMMVYMPFFGKPVDGNLVLWYAGMELSMVPGMIVLMWFQKHGWRHIAEMTGAMLIGPAIILFCAFFGWHNYIPGLSLNAFLGFSDLTMLLGMLAAMLYRRDMYTGSHGAHHHHAG